MIYYTSNNIGSTVLLTNDDGNDIGQFLYSPYGELWVEEVSTVDISHITRFFTNQAYDRESGLYFMNARYYDPHLGSFISPDPGFANLNHYAYCSANPIKYTDPTGLAEKEDDTTTTDDNSKDSNKSSDNTKDEKEITNEKNDHYIYAKKDNWNDKFVKANEFVGDFANKTGILNQIAYGIYSTFGKFAGAVWMSASGGNKNYFSGKTYFEGEKHDALWKDIMIDFAAPLLVGYGIGARLSSGTVPGIKTPYGNAYQSNTIEALQLREAVLNGKTIYRIGNLDKSVLGAEGQFWSPIHPNTSNYANMYGLPKANTNFNFINGGVLKPNVSFIVREAPGIGVNKGGALEIVTPPKAVNLDFFSFFGKQ